MVATRRNRIAVPFPWTGRPRTGPGLRAGARSRVLPFAVLLSVVVLTGTVIPVTLALFTDSASSTGAFTAAILKPPTGVSATGGLNATLTWTSSTSSGATGYTVERATTQAGTYAQIGIATPVSATSYVDAPASGTFWYRLSTYRGSWASATTAPVSATVSGSMSTGAKACTPGSNAPDTGGNGDGYETNADNACSSNGAVAVDANTGSSGRSMSCANAANDRERYWGYAFGLPGSVTSIDGVTVRADAGMNNNGGSSNLCVQLSWDGGTSWTTAKSVTLSGSAIASYTFGSSSDTWGHTWTSGQLSTSSFRVRLIDATSNPNKDYRLDYVAVTVQYTP